MPNPSPDLMELILRECAHTSEHPWYPTEFATNTGVEKATLDESLDQLRMAGLIRLTEWVPGKGQGYQITEDGEAVLDSPRLLDQLHQHGTINRKVKPVLEPVVFEEKPTGWDRAQEVRDSLITPIRPWVTQTLLVLNIANYLLGLSLAAQEGVINEFLSFGAVGNILRTTGSLGGMSDILSGQWWRLLSCCFVHAGLLHLGMNMYVLFAIGRMLEQMWGHYRYLALYLIAGLGGSVAAVIFRQDTGLVGASGAICGLIGSMLGWILMNKKYLPPQMASAWTRNILTNIVLIVVISLLPRVSAEGHFGGGIVGFLVAIPLNLNRFGKGYEKWLGVLGVALIPVLILGLLNYRVSLYPEQELARRAHTQMIFDTDRTAVDIYKEVNKKFLKKLKEEGSVSQKEKEYAFQKIDQAQETIQSTIKSLSQADKYQNESINQAIENARVYFEKWNRYFDQVKKSVDAEGNLIPAEFEQIASLEEAIENDFDKVQNSILLSSGR